MMSPKQLLEEAKRKGIRQLALTDINTTSGILDFFRQAGNYDIRPVAGIDFRNGSEQKFIGIAKNAEGFYELNKFLSYHLHNKCEFEDRAPVFNNGFIIYPLRNAPKNLKENEFIGIQQSDLNRLLFSDVRHLRNKMVILQPVTFPENDTREINGKHIVFQKNHIYKAHRLLRAMDNNTILTKLKAEDVAGENEVMLPEAKVLQIFSDYSFAIANSISIFEQCKIDFEFGVSKNKDMFYKDIREDREKLRVECAKGLDYRYGNPDQKIIDRFDKEIEMITMMGFTAYFLINWDIVQYAKSRNFFYVGRGSGANSVVAYLLGITDVDPIELDLYFERFINPSRKNPPDFDIDFSSSERNEVIQYIFNKHGYEHTSLLATYSTLQENAVVRELGKVFGLPKVEIDVLSDLGANSKLDGIARQVFGYGNYLKDFPSHLSIHAGGILISKKPIHYYTATLLPPKDFPLTQFSMLEAEDVGLAKFDILAQRGLGKVKDAVEVIRQNCGRNIDIHQIAEFKKDEKVRENLETANLMGCFYVESPAMRMLLKKLKAKTYLDLVAASSIIRPGVAQSGMMREYILRFHDESKRKYSNPLVEDLLKETFGVMVYQEDVIKVAHYFAGLSLEESDKLRRGMGGKYRGREEFAQVKEKFFSNCRGKGYDESLIEEVWRQMESFGGYAFAKGHSASYAVESYQCMYLKTHYPLEYMVAVINNAGGFYGLEFYVNEARKHGAFIHAPDINKSEYKTTIYGNDIYLGFMHMREFEEQTAVAIVEERKRKGEFKSLEDFAGRVNISLEQVRILIGIGAFRFTARSKQQLLWDIHMLLRGRKRTEVRNDLFSLPIKKFHLPELYHSKIDNAWDEIEILDFSLTSPFEMLKQPLPCGEGMPVSRAADLQKHMGKSVSIIGQLVTRKIATTKYGQAMSFGTFLDKDGEWIDTTHFPEILKKYPFRGKGCYLITGKVVEEFGFYSIDVAKIEKLVLIDRYAESSVLMAEA